MPLGWDFDTEDCITGWYTTWILFHLISDSKNIHTCGTYARFPTLQLERHSHFWGAIHLKYIRHLYEEEKNSLFLSTKYGGLSD